MGRVACGLLALWGLVACQPEPWAFMPTKDTVASSSGSGGDGGASEEFGGGGAEGQPGAYVSGSRLRVRRLVAEDGSSQQIGFYDSDLQVGCFFAMTVDGEMRCIPSGAATIGSYFIDPGCTLLATVWPKNCTEPTYALRNEGTCDVRYRVYPIGPPSGALYSGTPTACTNQASQLTTIDAFMVGNVISPNEFVMATEETD